MKREYHHWYSQHTHRNMELLVFGHGGAKVLVFPTRDGRFYEHENIGIVHALHDKISAGHLQLFCLDNMAQESLYCTWRHPAERISRHIQYEAYILHEVMPFMQAHNQHPCTIAFGCSLGAYYATNLAFRHPHLFRKLTALSGRFDLTQSVENFSDLFDGFYNEDIYFHTPLHFLPNLDCAGRLHHLRHMEIVLVVGKEDPFLGSNHHLSHLLTQKGIGHALHEWDGRAHQGRYWRKMVKLYI